MNELHGHHYTNKHVYPSLSVQEQYNKQHKMGTVQILSKQESTEYRTHLLCDEIFAALLRQISLLKHEVVLTGNLLPISSLATPEA
jgi:hypothetical protein